VTGADPVGLSAAAAAGSTAWQDEPGVVAAQRRTVWVLVAAQVTGGVGTGAAASMAVLLAESVTASESMAGIARTASTVGAAAVGLPLAMLAIRRGRRIALGLGWTVAFVGGLLLIASAIERSVVLLVLGMLMFGSGSATNLQTRYAAADLAPPLRRARALAVAVWATTIGAVLGPNLGGPGTAVARVLGLPELAGAFVISGASLLVAIGVITVLLRPDPLLLARRREHVATVDEGRPRSPTGVRALLRIVASSPRARFAFAAIVFSQTAMTAVMTMTPVHMSHHGASLTVVGLTISAHIVGMFAFSPLVGILADRWGPGRTVVLGQAVFVASAAVSGLAGGSVVGITVGLFLLGLGWSASLVAGSSLLGSSVPAGVRPAVQGLADTGMNVVSAVAAGLSGPVLAGWGFGPLNLLAGLLVVPVLVLLPRRSGTRSGRSASEDAPKVRTPGLDAG